jgi:hypothetical protein
MAIKEAYHFDEINRLVPVRTGRYSFIVTSVTEEEASWESGSWCRSGWPRAR